MYGNLDTFTLSSESDFKNRNPNIRLADSPRGRPLDGDQNNKDVLREETPAAMILSSGLICFPAVLSIFENEIDVAVRPR